MQRLLHAAEALELVRETGPGDPGDTRADGRGDAPAGGAFALGRLGATFVANPALEALVLHHAALYADLEDPLALLAEGRGSGRLARLWTYATASTPAALAAGAVAPYSTVMSATQALVARQVLDAYPLRRHRCLLDVGGGEGGFLAAALAASPGLRGLLWDLPAVAERARVRLAARGFAGRVVVHGGDFKRQALPCGADVASLVRVLYDHDDEPALSLLVAVRAALPRGGVVLVAEPLARTRGAERMGAAYFGLYLWAMGSGRVRSAAEHVALLREAGFRQAREWRTALPLQSGLVVAQAP
jgi:demethylspheroidene O-methyltransferase